MFGSACSWRSSPKFETVTFPRVFDMSESSPFAPDVLSEGTWRSEVDSMFLQPEDMVQGSAVAFPPSYWAASYCSPWRQRWTRPLERWHWAARFTPPYADDLLLFFSNPVTSVSAVRNILDTLDSIKFSMHSVQDCSPCAPVQSSIGTHIYPSLWKM